MKRTATMIMVIAVISVCSGSATVWGQSSSNERDCGNTQACGARFCRATQALTTAPGDRRLRLRLPNLGPANVLNKLDIDADGLPDNSPDTDGDGLPDNWEIDDDASIDSPDLVVFFPAPSAIVPGTPPTPIFTRRAVATSQNDADTDHDGLSDFVEVFGLMFLDDNCNGILDGLTIRAADGGEEGEWNDDPDDRNDLPNTGEWPVSGAGPDAVRDLYDLLGNRLLNDFDGYVFTDPTNPDTDGDGILDGADLDPLINPRSFGIIDTIIVRFSAEDNPDVDRDGLGNGMDMGNDVFPPSNPGTIDNPANLRELLGLFREDLLGNDIVTEAAIEDLLGADWDGNGLWRTTDVRDWAVITGADAGTLTEDVIAPDLPASFTLTVAGQVRRFFRSRTPMDLMTSVADRPLHEYGNNGIGLGWQRILEPSSDRQFPQFIPDEHIWAILYAWRVPGFDIDGDGFVGVPNISAAAPNKADPLLASSALGCDRSVSPVGSRQSDILGCAGGVLELSSTVPLDRDDRTAVRGVLVDEPLDDRIQISDAEAPIPELNGVVEAPRFLTEVLSGSACGAMGLLFPTLTLCGVAAMTFTSRIRRGRKSD